MTSNVSLPWPPSALRPNASSPGNWWLKSKPAAKYKADCIICCRAADVHRIDATSLHLAIRFRPPDRRRRDLDGMLSSIKQGLDAIAEVTGIDDSRFDLSIARGEPVKGGSVEIAIVPMEAM